MVNGNLPELENIASLFAIAGVAVLGICAVQSDEHDLHVKGFGFSAVVSLVAFIFSLIESIREELLDDDPNE